MWNRLLEFTITSERDPFLQFDFSRICGIVRTSALRALGVNRRWRTEERGQHHTCDECWSKHILRKRFELHVSQDKNSHWKFSGRGVVDATRVVHKSPPVQQSTSTFHRLRRW